MGGLNKQGLIVANVHVINPTQHTVTALAPMNIKRVGASVCYVPPLANVTGSSSKGYIYVFGGRTDN